jgi:hypothetical protein
LSAGRRERIEDSNLHTRLMREIEREQPSFHLAQYQQCRSADIPSNIAAHYGLKLLLFNTSLIALYLLLDIYWTYQGKPLAA